LLLTLNILDILLTTVVDNADIDRKIKNLFTSAKMLIRKFSRCSVDVKIKLFKAYCLCFYDISLWSKYSIQHFNKFRSCYHKCFKAAFGYSKFSSVTGLLLDLKLHVPSFNTVVHNACLSFRNYLSTVDNITVLAVSQ